MHIMYMCTCTTCVHHMYSYSLHLCTLHVVHVVHVYIHVVRYHILTIEKREIHYRDVMLARYSRFHCSLIQPKPTSALTKNMFHPTVGQFSHTCTCTFSIITLQYIYLYFTYFPVLHVRTFTFMYGLVYVYMCVPHRVHV
jgi:hypothetical protein